MRFLDTELIEQRRQVVDPDVHGVALERPIGAAIAALIVEGDVEMRREGVPRHRPVTAPEHRAADQRQRLTSAKALVVGFDPVGFDVRHITLR